jgi:hypothetical protein
MSKSQAGKGDKPRPLNKQVFDTNFDAIKWKNTTSSQTKEIKKAKGKTVYKY